jgi:hypothetical protein
MRVVRVIAALVLLAASMAASASMPRFEDLEKRLDIRPDQKEQYDVAVGATKRALLAVAASALEMKQRLAEELMKPRPDFSGFFRGADKVFEQQRPLFEEAGREWKKLFKKLDDKQVEVVKEFLRENLGELIAPLVTPSSGPGGEWI